ncbi:hypothetical protein K2Z84_03350, partial [Candidatus Binatia bacterium]|nr:hypothetical protein [Candidatus Binatia bacterium]
APRRSASDGAGDGAERDSPPDGAAALRILHARQGLDIDATTAAPRWDGTPVDYGLAVQALLATAPAHAGPA